MMKPMIARIVFLVLSLASHGLALAQEASPARSSPSPSSPSPLRVYAASSLGGALKSVATRYENETGEKIDIFLGPAGLLLEKIENGGDAELFLSANMKHPAQLAREGRGLPPVVFTRNAMCVLAKPGFGLTSDNLLDKLLDPATRIGTSTPHADPGGDYAWALFAKAEYVHPGAQKILEDKAQKLVGGEILPQPGSQPGANQGGSPVKHFLTDGTVDTFIGYCSRREAKPDPDFSAVRTPENLTIAVDYGLTPLSAPPPERQLAAQRFALYLLTPKAQAILADYGFTPVTGLSRP
ncbi:substrate-binding domain-containing protein [Beijerinckia indica]|uniref:Molybdenum ABC transporter, periplasmic molybdate-binding protein n=1 Tax=Beijerinckia indica subsp. indica (strain ATCC 9039 / DSM 1715 / NCIMB 8712) TaxID=395963 RepID=B2IHI9_BEII9|nr:substrate-binding domain-containing protein [Beijerinckia indica]ACB94510.1 conserved hypothetical protein [Beijerinckia indica subsp. indica ATCC 9039]